MEKEEETNPKTAEEGNNKAQREKINKYQQQQRIEKINETKSWFFKKDQQSR